MCKCCGNPKILARGMCNRCYKKVRYVSYKEEFPITVGRKIPTHRILTNKETNAIDACARRRGINHIGNISKHTIVGGIRFY